MHARTTARVRVAAASVPVIYCKWKRNGTRTDLFGVFDILRVLRCAGAGLEGGFDIDEFSFRVRFGAGTEQQSEKGGRVGCKLNFRKHVRWKCVFFFVSASSPSRAPWCVLQVFLPYFECIDDADAPRIDAGCGVKSMCNQIYSISGIFASAEFNIHH